MAVVTGATSGIGLELARLLAQDGVNLVLVARRARELTQIAAELGGEYKIRAVSYVKDLSEPGAAQELILQIRDNEDPIDILINNAGFGDLGLFAESDFLRQTAMINLNVTSLVELSHLVLPSMLERGFGRILNVASLAGFVPGPLMSVYYASKAFVLHFSEALAIELDGSGVAVTTLCPGPVPTGFQEAAHVGDSTRMMKEASLDARTVARIGYEGMARGKTIVIPGWRERLIPFSLRLTPRRMAARIARKLHEP